MKFEPYSKEWKDAIDAIDISKEGVQRNIDFYGLKEGEENAVRVGLGKWYVVPQDIN